MWSGAPSGPECGPDAEPCRSLPERLVVPTQDSEWALRSADARSKVPSDTSASVCIRTATAFRNSAAIRRRLPPVRVASVRGRVATRLSVLACIVRKPYGACVGGWRSAERPRARTSCDSRCPTGAVRGGLRELRRCPRNGFFLLIAQLVAAHPTTRTVWFAQCTPILAFASPCGHARCGLPDMPPRSVPRALRAVLVVVGLVDLLDVAL